MLRRRFRRQSGRNAQKSERNIFLGSLLSANDTHTDSASPGRERPFSHSVEVSTRTDKPRGAQALVKNIASQGNSTSASSLA